MGVKITAPDLQKAVAGTTVLVLHCDDEVEDLKQEVMKDLDTAMEAFTRQPRGVLVQASTLGACDVLLGSSWCAVLGSSWCMTDTCEHGDPFSWATSLCGVHAFFCLYVLRVPVYACRPFV